MPADAPAGPRLLPVAPAPRDQSRGLAASREALVRTIGAPSPAADPGSLRLPALILLALACALVSAPLAAARGHGDGEGQDGLSRQFDGSVVALTQDAFSLRLVDGSTVSCDLGHTLRSATVDPYVFTPGQLASLFCLSLDDGVTWELMRAYPQTGNLNTVKGTVMELSPSRVVLATAAGIRFACSRGHGPLPGGKALALGHRVSVTCVFHGGYALARVAAVKGAKPLTRFVFSGIVIALDGSTLLVNQVLSDGGSTSYSFAVPASQRAAVTALSQYGTAVTVTAKPAGSFWLVVSIAAG